MADLKKISATLSIAATVLLQACGTSTSEQGSTVVSVENTKAPALVGLWSAGCATTSVTSTTTGSSGSTVIPDGTAVFESFDFKKDGQLIITTENFASTNCNANTSKGAGSVSLVYTVGEGGTANDGSSVTGIDLNGAGFTLYSIFQIVDSSSLYLGSATESSAGRDGKDPATRYDGLGSRMVKL